MTSLNCIESASHISRTQNSDDVYSIAANNTYWLMLAHSHSCEPPFYDWKPETLVNYLLLIAAINGEI